MANIDNIISKYTPQMAEFFASTLKEVEGEILPLQDKLDPLLKKREELRAILKELGYDSDNFEKTELQRLLRLKFDSLPSISRSTEYNPKWSTLEKTVYLTKNSGFLTLSKIADLISEYEPERDKESLKNNLSVIFSQDSTKPEPERKLIRRKNDEKKWEYKAK